MDRNKLFEMCIAAGFTAEHVNEYERAFEALVETVQYFERVKEREACAKVCEETPKMRAYVNNRGIQDECAAAIRARGQQ